MLDRLGAVALAERDYAEARRRDAIGTRRAGLGCAYLSHRLLAYQAPSVYSKAQGPDSAEDALAHKNRNCPWMAGAMGRASEGGRLR